MSGGGRRPSSTRRSPARDSRRSVSPPARLNINGNAGYAAVKHGSNGRFTRKAAAAHGNGSADLFPSRTGPDATFETQTEPLMHVPSLDSAIQGEHIADPCSGNAREQQHAMLAASQGAQDTAFISDSMLLDDGNVAGRICNGLLDKESISSRQDEDMQSSILQSPQGVCGFAQEQQQGRSAHVTAGSISVTHGGTADDYLKAPSSSLDYVSDVCMDSGGSKLPTLHGTCSQQHGTQDVCNNAPSKQPTSSAPPSVWKKQGVVPLPSLQELGNPPSLNGAAQLDDEEVKGYMDRFRSALVGRLFGRHLPFFHLNNELHRRWDGFGSFKLLTLSSDCFICFFENAAARDAVLLAGPWALAGQLIGLNIWTPSFSPSTMHGFVTPIWIRFPGLPLYCWGRKSLVRIASALGEPVWIDDATAEMSRASYARVCIRADLSKPLMSSVRVMGLDGPFQQPIEYECLPTFCFKCGRVGHKDNSCPKHGSPPSKPQSTALNQCHEATAAPAVIVPRPIHSSFGAVKGTLSKDSPSVLEHLASNSSPTALINSPSSASADAPPQSLHDSDDVFGPWMVVQYRRRKPAPPKKPKLTWLPSSRGSKLLSASVQNLSNEMVKNFSSPHLQDSVCAASLQEPLVLEHGGSPVQPLSVGNATVVLSSNTPKNDLQEPLLQGSNCAASLQEPHALENGASPMQPVSDGIAPMVFSSNSPNIFDNAPSHSLTRVNSNSDKKQKIKGSLVKSKQAFYDAGPLIIESHKKRRPSIQSIGEDASSSAME